MKASVGYLPGVERVTTAEVLSLVYYSNDDRRPRIHSER